MNALSGTLLPACLISLVICTPAVSADSCEVVVKKLQTWYQSTPSGCGSDPAVDCSGILMRGTHRAPNGEYDVWNPSPNSEQSGGVSMSWMRSDKIGYEDPGLKANNGIIFTPRQFVEAPQKKLDVFCAYPIDAWTDFRTERGCGDFSQTPQIEKSCQALGIKDVADWKRQYDALGGSADRQERHKRQCAFSMSGSQSREGRRDAFAQFIKARQAIADTQEGRQVQTELRVVSWKKGEDVPVAAFFYSNAQGKRDAQKNQFDYYQRTGNWVPVVNMGFPANANQKARFACEQGAQHRDLPRRVSASAQSCKSYIDKAQWIQRDDPYLGKGVWSLSVTPTDCGRTIKEDQTDAMYAELVSKYANDPRWSGADYGGGMRRQLVCHMALVDNGREVRNKGSFNLEPVRPDVSHQASLKQGCNPYPAVRYP
ncbi:DUF2599 domain-containing protein [Pseudomonas cremoricolorata]|uniref:DUF2599 domain-containing protein n=1 Tax=Pseudomonas cremoricolorata TaxID=157783 RepID=A0A089WM82_9PSED|nr:DUF2599 domain-containing protein [Pseudomonas cremoricolorata]AIR89676.1 hypothetical protein LK03_10410 [Pseudomonas cremoricolorata]